MRRIDRIKEMHTKAFLGETDYIPLTIKVEDSDTKQFSAWDIVMNHELALEVGLDELKLYKQVNSDWVPNIDITNSYQDILVPSMFGAKLFNAKDFYPMPVPCINDIKQIRDYSLENINIYTPLMEQAIKHFDFLRLRVSEDIEVLAPTVTSPLDYAINMRGGDFYIDMLIQSEISQNFLMLLTELIIKEIKIFKEIAGEPNDSYITKRGLHFPGIRIACDSIVNLSPTMIQEFIFPVFKRLSQEFKRVLVHFCTSPAPSTHVLPTLMKCPYVTGVDNWQGYRTFFDDGGIDLLQEKLSICTDIPQDKLDEELKAPFFTQAKRRGGRGLFVSTSVSSINEGKELYHKWQELFLGK